MSNEDEFQCDKCPKKCKSKSGLSRHLKSKHHYMNACASAIPKVKRVELHPLKLKTLLEEAVRNLSKDTCYPNHISKEISQYTCSYENIVIMNEHITKVLNNNNDHEVAMPKLYKLFGSCDIFPGLSPFASRLLGSELSIAVLGHVQNPSKSSEVVTVPLYTKFSDKEIHSLVYVAGCVFGTLYRRFRFNKSLDFDKFLPLLLAGKSDKSLNIHKLADAKDRGGLWRVTTTVMELFKRAEQYFIVYSSHWETRFDTDTVVELLVKDTQILAYLNALQEEASVKVEEVDSLDLLEKLLTLYLRIRYFSYAKSKIEAYRVSQRKGKGKALRKQLKSSDICES